MLIAADGTERQIGFDAEVDLIVRGDAPELRFLSIAPLADGGVLSMTDYNHRGIVWRSRVTVNPTSS